ncbi:MAG: ferritin-like domain-containing protein [Desulfitobacteriia bacterium]
MSKSPKRERYSDSSPYPEIKVIGPNIQYAELLMDAYAGTVSEFTAISQYLYHSFFFKNINKELGSLLENVAITEMHHMEILATLIIKLGGNPVIRGSYSTKGTCWTGNFVFYGTNVCEQLQADLVAEQKAIADYKRLISLISDPYVQSILRRIILDEIVHTKLFEQALSKYCGR